MNRKILFVISFVYIFITDVFAHLDYKSIKELNFSHGKHSNINTFIEYTSSQMEKNHIRKEKSFVNQDRIIEKIVVSGNSKILSSTICEHMNVLKGDMFSLEVEKRILQNLYKTKFFQKINLKFQDNVIYVKVQENQIVSKIKVEGNHIVDTKLIMSSIITLKEGEYLDRYKIFSDLRRIAEIYKSKSIVGSKIDYKIIKNKKNPYSVKVIYKIVEGTKPKASKILFNGNEAISQAELENVLINIPSNYLISILLKNNLSQNGIAQDIMNLENLYKSLSYAQVEVKSNILYKDKRFYITYSIKEGAKYRFGINKVNFNSQIPGISEEDILNQISTNYGNDFNILDINESEQNILSFLRNKNKYIDVLVRSNLYLDEANHLVDIEFTIENIKKIYVKNINISENYKMEDIEIRENFLLHEGDLLYSHLYNKSLEKLFKTGSRAIHYKTFSKFSAPGIDDLYQDILITEVSKNSEENLSVEGYGKKNLSLKVSVTTEGGIGSSLHLKEPNFLGKSLLLDMNFFWGTAVNNYNLSFIKDNFLIPNTYLGFLFETKKTKNSESEIGKHISEAGRNFYNFNEDSFSNKIFLGQRKDEISIVWSVFSNIRNISILNKHHFIQKDEGQFYENVLDWKIEYRKLKNFSNFNNPFFQEGFATSGGIQAILPYEKIGHVGMDFNLSYARKLSPLLLWTTKFMFGAKIPFHAKEVKVFQRFNLGDRTMRGFKEEGIGPVLLNGKNLDNVSKVHLGGNYMYKMSTEILLNLDFINKIFLSIVPLGFIDIGSVWGISKKELYPEVVDKYRTRISCGVGARILLPAIGALEIGYGKPILFDKKSDLLHSFHFSLGTNLLF